MDEAIPIIEGSPFHRILARGALLATETVPGSPPEGMIFRRAQPAYSAAPSTELLQSFASDVTAELAQHGLAPRLVSQQMFSCAVSAHACAKIIVERNAPADTRTEIRYLIRDRASLNWELFYLIRRENLPRWAPLLAEIEGAPSVLR